MASISPANVMPRENAVYRGDDPLPLPVMNFAAHKRTKQPPCFSKGMTCDEDDEAVENAKAGPPRPAVDGLVRTFPLGATG